MLESRVFIITVIRNPLNSFKQGLIQSVAIACRSNLRAVGMNFGRLVRDWCIDSGKRQMVAWTLDKAVVLEVDVRESISETNKHGGIIAQFQVLYNTPARNPYFTNLMGYSLW